MGDYYHRVSGMGMARIDVPIRRCPDAPKAEATLGPIAEDRTVVAMKMRRFALRIGDGFDVTNGWA